jgi:hypothetical protein
MGFLSLVALPASSEEPQQGWGDLKGQVAFGGDKMPTQENGRLPPGYSIDLRTKGMKWVFVALVDPKNLTAALPVHPVVAKTLPKRVTLDTPGEYLEPRLLGIVEGQVVEVKNTSKQPHAVQVDGGGAGNPNFCQLLTPDKVVDLAGWKASTRPVPVSDRLNPQARGWIRVYAHPYFAVTDTQGNWEIKNAPAGEWNLVVWHEGEGYGPGGRMGVPIKVVADKITDLGVAKIK